MSKCFHVINKELYNLYTKRLRQLNHCNKLNILLAVLNPADLRTIDPGT